MKLNVSWKDKSPSATLPHVDVGAQAVSTPVASSNVKAEGKKKAKGKASGKAKGKKGIMKPAKLEASYPMRHHLRLSFGVSFEHYA